MTIAVTKILMALSMVFTICLTSCEEGTTVDIPGPDIDFQFSYSDATQNLSPRSSKTEYRLVAKSDTIKGKDIESFLANSGKDYTSVIETATITNALLTLSGDSNFSGVDSIQIRYQVDGSDAEIVLAQAAVNGSNGQTMSFSDLSS